VRVTEKFCREQESLQIAKAASETLKNRKDIALSAAKAWDTAAQLAHKQESKLEPLDKLDAAITLEFAEEEAAGLPVDDETDGDPT
jgi:PIN domain nuclease of toxin-antitoxin system